MDKATRRQQILMHARDVFAKHGYHAAKIDDIVVSAKIARGTFYLYFEDKRAIFEEIVDRVLARFGMTIMPVDPHDPTRSVADQVRENIRRILAVLLEDRATTTILLSSAAGIDPAFDRKLASFYGEVEKLLEDSFRDGQALGLVIPSDPKLLTHLTIGAMKELLYQLVHRGWDYPKEQLVEEVFSFFGGAYLQLDLSPRQGRTAPSATRGKPDEKPKASTAKTAAKKAPRRGAKK